jgi:hypothetical protein
MSCATLFVVSLETKPKNAINEVHALIAGGLSSPLDALMPLIYGVFCDRMLLF